MKFYPYVIYYFRLNTNAEKVYEVGGSAAGVKATMRQAYASNNVVHARKLLHNLARTLKADHPSAEIGLYRHGKYSVRVRIVDPSFAGESKPQRHRVAWPYLVGLPEETLSDLSTLLLVTPDEKAFSFASMDFDDPLPSLL